MGFDRRTFLKSAVVGGGTMLAATELFDFLAQAAEQEPDEGTEEDVDRGPAPPRADERWALGMCGLCSSQCGLLARLVSDRVVRLRGSPFHPFSRLGLCPRGVAGTQLLYHPGRILTPLRRTGARGGGSFEPISWEKALDEIAPHLKDSSGVMVVAPRTKAYVAKLRRFVLPGATFVEHRPYHETRWADPALFMTQGIWGQPAYDLEACDFILSFESGLLERSRDHGETLAVYGRARGKGRCRLVHVESRRSVTGDLADEWVAVRRGTEATLALGIAHALIKEGLVDRAFLSDHCFGYEDWTDARGDHHEGFRSRVLRHFDPSSVADATSVPIETVIRLARSFANAPRALALGCDRPGVHGPYTRMAIHCLNALVGSIERPGGVLAPQVPAVEVLPPSRQEAGPETGDNGEAVLAGPSGRSAESVLAGLGKSPRALVISGADVIGEAVDRASVQGTVAGSELVLAIATLRDATVDQADIVLPAATYLERFMDSWDRTSRGYGFVALSAPVLNPLGESRGEEDIWIDLAKRLSRDLPFGSYEDVLKAAMEKVHGFGRGQLFGLENEEIWLQVLEDSGWKPPAPQDAEGFWEGALEVGGWWDPIYYHEEWKRALTTPSGKFEFHAQTLAALLPRAGDSEPIELEPHQPKIAEPDGAYTLALELFTPTTVGGLAGRLSWLRSLAGGHVNVAWNTWVELNPDTARALDLEKGARARVRSAAGSIDVDVVLSPTTPPMTAAIPCGILATDTDPEAGADPLTLLTPEVARLTGEQSYRSTWVLVEPLKGGA